MNKTDKELAVEIVIAAINAKVGVFDKDFVNNNRPMIAEDIPAIIEQVYTTLKALKD